MARIDYIEGRLWRWAEAVKSGGRSIAGYPVVNVLHASWSPPAPGMAPTLRVVPRSDAPQTHRAVCRLSEKAQATLAAHYIKRLPNAAAAELLQCTPGTVAARIVAAQRELAHLLDGPASR